MLVSKAARVLGGPRGRLLASELHHLADDVPPHTHEFCELAVVIDGQCEYQSARGRFPAGPGTVVAVRPGEWHAYHGGDDLTVFNVYFTPDLLAGEFRWMHQHAELVDLWWRTGALAAPVSAERFERLSEWIGRLESCQRENGHMMSVQLRSLFTMLVCELVLEPTRESGLSEIVMAAVAVMETELAHEWTVDQVARNVSVSKTHLYRLFQSNLGSSPIAWLNRARAEKMSTLLTTTDATVGSIGASVGWGDPNYATRRFRTAFGMPPVAYRARYSPSPSPRPPSGAVS